jgi:hypothetical protein
MKGKSNEKQATNKPARSDYARARIPFRNQWQRSLEVLRACKNTRKWRAISAVSESAPHLKAESMTQLVKTRKSEARVRIQFDLRQGRYEHLQALMAQTGIETNKDLFENALTLMEWAVEETLAGHTIGVKTPDGFSRLLFAPLLALPKNDTGKNQLTKSASTITSDGNQTQSSQSREPKTGEPSGSVTGAGNRYHHQESDKR